MSRITLITYFNKKELNKIYKHIKNINFKFCKVPYGIDDQKRYEIDNLPFHFTIFATNKENQLKLLNILDTIKIRKIKLKVNEIKIMCGNKNSYVLYFGIEENIEIKNLQKMFYDSIQEEKYNPDNFRFHLTIHIDNNKELIYQLCEKIKQNFEPFYLEIDKLALYDYPGEMIKIISIV